MEEGSFIRFPELERLSLRELVISGTRGSSEKLIFANRISLFDDPNDGERLREHMLPQLCEAKLSPRNAIRYTVGQILKNAAQLCVEKKTAGLSKTEFWHLASNGAMRFGLELPPDMVALLMREILRARLQLNAVGGGSLPDEINSFTGGGAHALLDYLGESPGVVDNLVLGYKGSSSIANKGARSFQPTAWEGSMKRIIGLGEQIFSRQYFEKTLDMPQSSLPSSHRRPGSENTHAGEASGTASNAKGAEVHDGRQPHQGQRRIESRQYPFLLPRKNGRR